MKSIFLTLVAMPLCVVFASCAEAGEPKSKRVGEDSSAMQSLIFDLETEMMVAIFDGDMEKAAVFYNAVTDIEMFVYGDDTIDQGRNGVTTASLGSGRYHGRNGVATASLGSGRFTSMPKH